MNSRKGMNNDQKQKLNKIEQNYSTQYSILYPEPSSRPKKLLHSRNCCRVSMDLLPVEIINSFSRYINFKDLKSLSVVNKRFRNILIIIFFVFPKFKKRLSLQVINDLGVECIRSSDIRIFNANFSVIIKKVILDSEEY